MRSGTAHVAFGSSDSLGPCDFKDFVAQSHTPDDHCVRFAVVVTFPDATLVTKRALPLTWAGLAPAGSRQLRLAHRYGFNQWDGLLRFLDDGRIEIDSNTVERSMRPVALNRKNALFAGSDEGAENWAMLASLIETCKLHGINPHAYLTDVLTKLVNNWPNRHLDELLPWSWTPEAA